MALSWLTVDLKLKMVLSYQPLVVEMTGIEPTAPGLKKSRLFTTQWRLFVKKVVAMTEKT